MVKPSFTMQVSLGNVLTFVSLAIPALIAGTVAIQDIEDNRESIASTRNEFTIDMTEIRNGANATEARLRVVENNYARADERLNTILTLLARIDSRLERIERADGAR